MLLLRLLTQVLLLEEMCDTIIITLNKHGYILCKNMMPKLINTYIIYQYTLQSMKYNCRLFDSALHELFYIPLVV